jgi:hypothetical protein
LPVRSRDPARLQPVSLQQFVEEHCSAKGVSDGLVDEIERVIFEWHSQDDREWALDFAELRDQQTARFQHSSLMTVVGIGGLTGWVEVGKASTHSDTFLKHF